MKRKKERDQIEMHYNFARKKKSKKLNKFCENAKFNIIAEL
jgi:hypothetical protein